MQYDGRFCLLSHHPKPISGDALGFGDYACAIREILAGLTTENTGLTIGIFGDWGSGKSTVLGMVGELLTPQKPSWRASLKRTLKRCRGLWYCSVGSMSPKGKRLKAFREQQQKAERIEPRLYHPLAVWFDAWEYSQDQVWVALLRNIVQTANKDLRPWQRVAVRLKLWTRRIRWNELLSHVAWAVIRVFTALLILYVGLLLIQEVISQSQAQPGWLYQPVSWLQTALGLSSITAAAWVLLSALSKWMWQGVRWTFAVRPSLPPNLLHPALDKDTPATIEQFRQELLDLIHVIGHRWPIVVLMDDLDRAPVDQIPPVLEAIQHFGVKPPAIGEREQAQERRAPIAFVVAADRRFIQHAISSHYQDFCSTLTESDADRFAREYLEKIVQVPYELPPLSISQLTNLLPEDTATSPERENGIWTLAAARQQVRSVLTQGPRENPRQVVQAYNTFQALWWVVQQRHLQEVEAKLLAALILIRYVWPEVFERFFRYPELFFDLHALASKEPNDVCCATEIEEMLTLGCPAVKPVPMIEGVRSQHPDLLRLLGSFSLPSQLNANRLFTYLTLIKDQPAPMGIHLIEVGAALLSGDPSLIKFAGRTSGVEVRQERWRWLIELLEPENLPAKSDSSTSNEQDKVIRALFALGRLKDGRTVEWIQQIVGGHTPISKAVSDRAIYALAHLAKVGTDKEAARRVLMTMLEDEDTSSALQLRILRLFTRILPEAEKPKGKGVSRAESESRRPIVRLALHGKTRFIRDTALEISRGWVEEALEEFNTGPQTKDAFDGYLQIAENLPGTDDLPDQVRTHLIGLAIDSRSCYRNRSFEILSKSPQLETVVEAMAEIAAQALDRKIREEAIKRMGEAQGNCELRWQMQAWKQVEQAIADESPDVWSAFMKALGATRRKEAVAHLKEIGLTHFDTRVRNTAIEALRDIADDRENPEAAAAAQAVLNELDELEGCPED